MRWKSFGSIAVAVLLTISVLGFPTAGGAATTGSTVSSGIASEQDVRIDVAIRWDSATPDRVQYTYSFDANSDSEFVLDIDEHIDSLTGFTKNADGNWEYDSSADTHRVTITQSVSESADHHDWVYSAESGVLVAAPHLTVRWDAGGYVDDENPLKEDYANVNIDYGSHSGFREWERIYVGPYTTYATEHDGETYTIYKPKLADDEPYDRAIRSIVATADRTPMSEAHATVDLVAFPDGEGSNPSVYTYSDSDWAGRAGGEPDGEAIVDSDRPVDDYSNTWAHEFVHLQQGYRDGPETDWFREAQAEYLTATSMHAVGCGDGDLDYFIDADSGTHDDVLSEKGTWSTSTPYEKGLATLSDFAAKLHARTDGQTTIDDVFLQMEDTNVETHDALVDTVNETVGDASLNGENARYLDQYVTTSDYPGDDNIDHPPIDRASSCLGNYQHIDVTETTHEDGTTTTPTPEPTATATPEPTDTATSTPEQTSTPQPDATATPTPDGADGGDEGNFVTDWASYAVDFAESCEVNNGGVSCGV